MSDVIRLLPEPIQATFVDRPNRYRLRARLSDNRIVHAFLPNPGRMAELLLPGTPISLIPAPDQPRGAPPRKTRFNAVAVKRGDSTRLLDTHLSNGITRELIERRSISALRDWKVIRQEVRVGRSRFDFELERRSPVGKASHRTMLLEVKTCNLVENGVALFPDAPTNRGRRHLEELAELADGGRPTGVLFLIQDPGATVFLPHWHTDPAFARSLFRIAARFPGATTGRHPHLLLTAAAIRTYPDLTVNPEVREVPILVDRLGRELADQGAYLILLRLARTRRLTVGALGSLLFPAGWYMYAGSAEVGLTARIERHRRTRKKLHWHIDYLRAAARFEEAFPVRSSRKDECDLAAALSDIEGSPVDRFGSSDCSCLTHLYCFDADPRVGRPFQDLIARFRHRVPPAAQ